jgi:hypothetical protein
MRIFKLASLVVAVAAVSVSGQARAQAPQPSQPAAPPAPAYPPQYPPGAQPPAYPPQYPPGAGPAPAYPGYPPGYAGYAPPQPPMIAAAPPKPHRGFSLTVSPLHLVAPVLELTGEARLADKFGAAVVLGAGQYSAKGADIKLTATVLEGGAQARYYVTGDFDGGVQLGAEALMVYLTSQTQGIDVKGQGLALGPFVGYKYTASGGFTFDGQVGYQRVVVAAQAESDSSSASDSASGNILLLNLNVGWSF